MAGSSQTVTRLLMTPNNPSNNGAHDPSQAVPSLPAVELPPFRAAATTPDVTSATAAAKPAPANSQPAIPAAAPAKPAAPPPTPPPPNPLPHIKLPFQGVDYAARGVHADASVAFAEVVFAAEQMDKNGFSLDTITGVDWIAQNEMEVVYDFFHLAKNLRAAIRTRIPREHPELPTISKVFSGANWHERETHDFFGIRFTGHPDLSPFLLPEDADFHPLRKDFGA